MRAGSSPAAGWTPYVEPPANCRNTIGETTQSRTCRGLSTTSTVVADFDDQIAMVHHGADRDTVRLGVLGDIGQGLRGDVVHGRRDGVA